MKTPSILENVEYSLSHMFHRKLHHLNLHLNHQGKVKCKVSPLAYCIFHDIKTMIDMVNFNLPTIFNVIYLRNLFL